MTGTSRLWPWLALGLTLLLGLQTQRLASTQVTLAQLESSQAEQVQAVIENKANALLKHAAAQQVNTHEYTQTLAKLEAGRTAADARIAGLQHDIRSAATRNAQAAGDAAACRDLADQHQRLATLAGEGADLVGQFGSMVKRRDAQVNALQGQIKLSWDLVNASD